MITLKSIKKPLVAVGSALTLLFGIAFAVNAMDKEDIKVENNTLAFEEWHYNGASTDSPTDASKYTRYSSETCGIEQETVCRLNAPASTANPNQPDMSATVTIPGQPSQTVAQRINHAIGGTTKQTNETVLDLRPE